MLRFAFRNLISRPVRSLLALGGLTIAIMGMVGLFSVARGIESTIANTFGRIPGLAVMQPGAPVPLFSRLPTTWGKEIATIPGVHVVASEIWSRAHLVEGKPNFSPPRLVCGIDPREHSKLEFSVYRAALKAGRFLEPADYGTNRTVISRPIAEQCHKVVGDSLRVDGYDLEIVGIYECGTLVLDVTIIIDIQLARRMMRINSESVCAFYVEPNSGVDRNELANRIKKHFHGRSLPPWQPTSWSSENVMAGGSPIGMLFSSLVGRTSKSSSVTSASGNSPAGSAEKDSSKATDEKTSMAASGNDSPENPNQNGPSKSSNGQDSEELPLEVRTAEDWSREFQKFSSDLDLFLLIMTSIGVTIAVLGIVNTMLMSVTERFIEFGILKANGWSDGDVLRLIAGESAILGVFGGVLGCLFGWLGTLAVNARWPTRLHLYASPGLLLFSLIFSIVVGILGGLYPAVWAARMRPMDAIRRG